MHLADSLTLGRLPRASVIGQVFTWGLWFAYGARVESKPPTPPDRAAAATAVADFLRALGHAPEGELADTAALVADAWCSELLVGYEDDGRVSLAAGALETSSRDAVFVRSIDAAMMCPHHLLPSHGVADVLYLPNGKVVGFGAVVRLVRTFTRRLILQEVAGRSIAEALLDGLGARGALVRLRMTHTCLSIRGASTASARVETVALAGTCAEPGPDQSLAFAMLHSEPSSEISS